MRVGLPPGTSPRFGFVEWFRIGEHDRVLEAIAGMRATGATYLRTHLSWAEYHAPGGQEWYDWLIPTLGRAFDLLPCVHYTPPSLSRTGQSSGPPKRLRDYADFIDHVLTRYGEHFTHVEIWNEPNNLLDWDWREDHDWLLFCEMAGAAAYWIEQRGWKAVLCGPSPFDAYWLDLMGQRGLLKTVSAVGFHGFPGTWDSEAASWQGYHGHLAEMRAVVDRYNPDAEIWITEAGYATWRHDEAQQVERFRDVLAAPAARVYWYGWQDIPREVPVQEGVYFDPRHYHLGINDAQGRPKLLRRLLENRAVNQLPSLPDQISAPSVARPASPIVVIGGAGFIGSNLVHDLLVEGEEVVVLDSLARPGVERNLTWLQRSNNSRLHTCIADIRDATMVNDVVRNAKAVFHLAAQVAVTSSLVDPVHDFAVNAQGTLTVLEAVRNHAPATPVIFASTNKVYGALQDIPVSERGGRHLPVDPALRAHGVGEDRPLDFCTPYGCSKGAADQYVLDYGKSFGLRTAVLRMSCIYGPRQFGTEDQGWVAHFLIKALKGEPITLYGDGRQVRDILHVSDAVAAYRSVLDRIDQVAGKAFNLGGGPANAVSLHEVLAEIAAVTGVEVPYATEAWRTGDQLYFVADTRRLTEAVQWRARIGWRDGLRDLAAWVQAELGLKAPGRVPERTAPQRMIA
ncbi:NAD-dependent epimerase/dehydratase family protein [Geminicoccus roseus]|uniref:NAD-dependent epimerase/dehydratase family protein n=1 Tax=Geminicoccus roseus TaxID=404900 RepID=UPI000685F813|nr:NAD-dependent epimerase/dehydratase family protein [Geminicoccus roseus]